MYRHQMSILRKEFLAPAIASLLMLTGSVGVHAATVFVSGSGSFGGTWVAPGETTSPTNLVQKSLPGGMVFQDTNLNITTAASIAAKDYDGSMLASDTTLTFDADLTLPKKLNVASNVNVTFQGTAGKTLLIDQVMGMKNGTFTVNSGIVKLTTSAPTNSNSMFGGGNGNVNYANITVNSGATLWIDQQRGIDRHYGKLTINGGTLIASRPLTMFGMGKSGVATSGITEMSGNGQVQVGNTGDIRLYSEKGAANSTLNVTGANANAKITGYNGTTGTIHMNNGSVRSDLYRGNYTFNVVDASSTLTIDVSMMGEENGADVWAAGETSLSGFTKAGEGKLVLANTSNKLQGATIIKAGTLEIADGTKLYSSTVTNNDAAFAEMLTNYKAGTAVNYDNYYDKSMVVVGTGANSTAVLRTGNLGTALGNLTSQRSSLILDGGAIVVTGDSQSTNHNFTVGRNGGTLLMEKAGQTLTFTENVTSGYFVELYGNLTIGGAGNIYMGDNNGNVDWLEKTGGLTKVGAGTVTLANWNNQYTGETIVKEGTLVLTGNLYNLTPKVPEGLTAVNTTIRLQTTTHADGTVAQGTFQLANFRNEAQGGQLGNLNTAASAFVIDGGRLVVTGNDQTARLFKMTTNGGTIEMQTAGKTLTINQDIVPETDPSGSPVNFNGNTIEVGGAGNIAMGGGKQVKAMNGTLLKTGSGTFTTTFLDGGMSGMDIVVREGTFVVAGGINNYSSNWANNIKIEEGAVMTVNQNRAVGRHFGKFVMETGSTLNLNNAVFMPTNNGDFEMNGTAKINILAPGVFNSIETTIKVASGKDSTGVTVNGDAVISGPGTLQISYSGYKIGFNVVGPKDRLTVDMKFVQEDETTNFVATKSGEGTMVQNWKDGSNFKSTFNVDGGTYAASGKVTAGKLNVNGGTGYVADGGSVAGNVYVGAPASFSAGYKPANDGTLLNSVGTIDVNGNMRIAGRLIVDVVEGQKDVINVGGTITLDDTFKFVVNVDDYASYAGWTATSILDGKYDADTLGKLQDMLEDGTLLEHLETNAGSLTLVLDENGNPVLADLNAIPEPATWVLLVLGTFGIGYMRKRNLLKK